jgi:hypothetical protein
VADAFELAELISSAEAVPASGWVAGVSASFAAALVAKAASRSEGWSDSAGARAQAIDLRDRLLALAVQDAHAYESALDALERREHDLGGALATAAGVPLALAGRRRRRSWPPTRPSVRTARAGGCGRRRSARGRRRGPPPSSSPSTSRPSPATSGSRLRNGRSTRQTTRPARRSPPRSSGAAH